jgi:hypothetical protein
VLVVAALLQEALTGEKRAAVLDDQVRGVYRLYRTFGGDDMDANRPSRDYRNTFQYAAIVSAKGALMFVDLQKTLGEERSSRPCATTTRRTSTRLRNSKICASPSLPKLRLNKGE